MNKDVFNSKGKPLPLRKKTLLNFKKSILRTQIFRICFTAEISTQTNWKQGLQSFKYNLTVLIARKPKKWKSGEIKKISRSSESEKNCAPSADNFSIIKLKMKTLKNCPTALKDLPDSQATLTWEKSLCLWVSVRST